MPKIKLNEHVRWLIVERILEGLSCRTIASQLNICKSTVSKVFLRFKKYRCKMSTKTEISDYKNDLFGVTRQKFNARIYSDITCLLFVLLFFSCRVAELPSYTR